MYSEIKDKLMRPQIVGYLEANPSWNSMFSEIIGAMTRDLCGAVGLSHLERAQVTKEEDRLFVTKNTEIARDFEVAGMFAKALIHYEMAYQRSKTMDAGIHWMVVQNFTKIVLRQNKGEQALSVLMEFVRSHQHHHHCMLFLTALSIESGHENAKAIVYELCDRHPIPTSMTMKAVYFALNAQEMRGDIAFKKAITALQHDLNPNLVDDLFGVLFDLKCLGVAGCILDHFQKLEQIDVSFHVNHAKLDAMAQRFGTAMSSIQEAIRINDEVPGLWAIKGHIEYDADKRDNAKQSYLRYLQLIPGTAESLLPRPKETECIRLDEKAMYRLGKMHEDEGAHRLSLQTYFQFIEFDPKGGSWLFWYEAGRALFKLKDYAESIRCFEQSNMVNNNEPHSWCILGLCYLAIQEPKTAIQMMKEGLAFGIDRISHSDLQRISHFGESLLSIGHIESGNYFKNAVSA